VPVALNTNEVPDNPFWHVLVTAIAPLSFPVAQVAAERLGLAAAGPISWLDVGGGSGVWSAAWLGLNKEATGYQLDWPNVNAIGRDFVARFGVADRFKTIDGDFHTTDFGVAKYAHAVYSHIAHQESPAQNVSIFRKFRQALKPGGTLVVNDFVLDDDRTGHPFAMMFASQMLVVTKEGFTYTQSDYRSWLREAGFTSSEIVPTGTPSTLVMAS
jgi:SAM-dependent methyltransferase